MTTIETKIAELKKELAEIRAEMKDESISDERWEHLRNYRHEISNEIENLEAEAATAEAGNNNDEVNTATCNGYIFTTYSTRTGFDSNGYTNDVESIEIKCDTLGNADNFDGIYRELTFFNEDNKDGWEVKTADGKILAKGTTEADAIKARGIICNADAEANFNLDDTKNFYEFVLHENAPITNVETDGSEEDDDDNEVFNLLPSVDELNDVDLTKSAYFDGRADLGYIFKLSVAINHSFDGTRPWTLESIDGKITVEGRTWQDYAKFIITDTDGSEEDDFVDEMPALYPAEDSDDDDELIDTPEIESTDNIFIGQDGTNYIIRAKNINITVEDRKIKINGHVVAKYKTDAGVQNALKYVTDWRNNIANYKTFDINDWNTIFDDFDFTGGNEDKFVYIDDEPSPTDKVITPDEMLAIVDTLETVNASAPYGWQISYDGKNFPVEFNGKTVATLDSLALAKVLPPDKFFDQFNPDVPPKEHYINERRKELDMLLDFRKFVEDDSDRLKTLANLIEDIKREILDAELDTEHPPDIEFDEHGDVIPWF